MGDKSGHIDESELESLCEALMLDASVGGADQLAKEGKIGMQELFAFLFGCSEAEAVAAFQQHTSLVSSNRRRSSLKDWPEDQVRMALQTFKDFDKNKSGHIDESELESLCEALMLDASMGDANQLAKEGKIGKQELFAFLFGCSEAEAVAAFNQHSLLVELMGKPVKEWSEDQVKVALQHSRT